MSTDPYVLLAQRIAFLEAQRDEAVKQSNRDLELRREADARAHAALEAKEKAEAMLVPREDRVANAAKRAEYTRSLEEKLKVAQAELSRHREREFYAPAVEANVERMTNMIEETERILRSALPNAGIVSLVELAALVAARMMGYSSQNFRRSEEAKCLDDINTVLVEALPDRKDGTPLVEMVQRLVQQRDGAHMEAKEFLRDKEAIRRDAQRRIANLEEEAVQLRAERTDQWDKRKLVEDVAGRWALELDQERALRRHIQEKFDQERDDMSFEIKRLTKQNDMLDAEVKNLRDPGPDVPGHVVDRRFSRWESQELRALRAEKDRYKEWHLQSIDHLKEAHACIRILMGEYHQSPAELDRCRKALGLGFSDG